MNRLLAIWRSKLLTSQRGVDCHRQVDIAKLASKQPIIVVALNESGAPATAAELQAVAAALHASGVQDIIALGSPSSQPQDPSHRPQALSNNYAWAALLPEYPRGLTKSDIEAIQRAALTSAGHGHCHRPTALVLCPQEEPLVVFAESSLHKFDTGARKQLSLRPSPAYLASKLQYPVVPAFVSVPPRSAQDSQQQQGEVKAHPATSVEFGLYHLPLADTAGERCNAMNDPELMLHHSRRVAMAQYDKRLRDAAATLRLSLLARRSLLPEGGVHPAKVNVMRHLVLASACVLVGLAAALHMSGATEAYIEAAAAAAPRLAAACSQAAEGVRETTSPLMAAAAAVTVAAAHTAEQAVVSSWHHTLLPAAAAAEQAVVSSWRQTILPAAHAAEHAVVSSWQCRVVPALVLTEQAVVSSWQHTILPALTSAYHALPWRPL